MLDKKIINDITVKDLGMIIGIGLLALILLRVLLWLVIALLPVIILAVIGYGIWYYMVEDDTEEDDLI